MLDHNEILSIEVLNPCCDMEVVRHAGKIQVWSGCQEEEFPEEELTEEEFCVKYPEVWDTENFCLVASCDWFARNRAG